MKITYAQSLQQKAKYNLGSTIQVYNIFDGWQTGQIIKLGWDHMFGCVQYYIEVTTSVRLSSEKYMREVK